MSEYKIHFELCRANTGIHLQGDWDTREEAEAYLKQHETYFSNGLEHELGDVVVREHGYSDFSDSECKLYPTRPLRTKGYVVASTLDDPRKNLAFLEDFDEIDGIVSVIDHVSSAHVFLDSGEALKAMAEYESTCATRVMFEVPIIETFDKDSLMPHATNSEGIYDSDALIKDAKIVAIAYPAE